MNKLKAAEALPVVRVVVFFLILCQTPYALPSSIIQLLWTVVLVPKFHSHIVWFERMTETSAEPASRSCIMTLP